MKLKRIVSLCAVVVFGASTAIYAANVTETEQVEEKSAVESFEQENKGDLAENEQLKELDMQEDVLPEKEETEKAESIETADMEQQKSTEAVTVAGAVENTSNAPQENENSSEEEEAVAVADSKSLIPSDSEREKEYKILKNSIVCDFNSGSEKRIVTKVNEDGTFLAEDLGSWLKKQDIFEITVVEDYGDYKKLFYEIVPENADRDEYYYEEGVRESLFLQRGIVFCGDCITCTGNCEEEVTEVLPDGSFYTDYTLNYLP